MKTTPTVLLATVLLLSGGCQKTKTPDKPSEPAPTANPAPPSRARRAPARRAVAPARQTSPRLVPLWSVGGLKVPESVQYDPVRRVLYVSCIHGKPTLKNGQGTIAKLSLDGKLLAWDWVKGLNAPKGMGLSGETLWVTDIDRLHAIDVKTGKIQRTIDVPEAKFLNDIAIGAGGKVYVSDMVRRTVHVLRGAKLPVLADLTSVKGANGMLRQGPHLLVGTATGIVRLDAATGKATMHVPVRGFGMVDGLKAYGDNAYLVSNWKGRTQLVRRGGAVTVLLDTTAQKIQSADLEYVAAKRMLIIPTFFHNRVVAYRVEP